MQKFRHIEKVFLESCHGWGYDEIRTPTLEYLHLFTSAGTLSPAMLGRVYSFLDWDGWSGERVVLRPDGTIPVARLYVQDLANTPIARLCYIENMFSFEGTGQQSRERWQCGVELLGSTEPEGDAELIMLALEILSRLDLKPVKVKLSHVGLLKMLLQDLGLAKEEQERKLSKILSGDLSVLGKIGEQPPEVKRFLKLLLNLQGTSQGFLGNMRSVLPERLSNIKSYLDDLAGIAELMDSIGQDYQVDFASGEGFEYYTGIVFQFYGSGELIGKGGRYDELIPLVGGKDVPASGFALFIDKLMPFVQEMPEPSPKILLVRENKQFEGMKSSFEVAGRLREQGYSVEMGTGSSGRGEYRWTVSLQNDGKLLNLVDHVTGKGQKGLSIDQLLQQLGEAKLC